MRAARPWSAREHPLPPRRGRGRTIARLTSARRRAGHRRPWASDPTRRAPAYPPPSSPERDRVTPTALPPSDMRTQRPAALDAPLCPSPFSLRSPPWHGWHLRTCLQEPPVPLSFGVTWRLPVPPPPPPQASTRGEGGGGLLLHPPPPCASTAAVPKNQAKTAVQRPAGAQTRPCSHVTHMTANAHDRPHPGEPSNADGDRLWKGNVKNG